jgi:hypothetical protein
MKKIVLPVSFFIILSVFTGCGNHQVDQFYNNLNHIEEISFSRQGEDKISQIEDFILPKKYYINVPFADQAPLRNWSDPYQEACEEAVIIMAKAYVDGVEADNLDKNYIDREIIRMVDYQIDKWGGHYDLDVLMTQELLKDYYDIDSKIMTIENTDDIKKLLFEDNIIITPTFGRNLSNPHFTFPGPVYHMLIINGYDENNFITHDPGIWQGRSFHYPYQNLTDSIADLPESAKYKEGYIKKHHYLMQDTRKNILSISR